ncbi:DUF5941 domain-containing protein [Kitasatospora sp. NPDC101155]|uniref:DUF5941 domain-containing protein n=1 Tax=Kitasatospora sp. NPDC101155 TaxID=3364097 RepID=UPI0037F60836
MSFAEPFGRRSGAVRSRLGHPTVTAPPPGAFGWVAPVAYHHIRHAARICAGTGAPPPGRVEHRSGAPERRRPVGTSRARSTTHDGSGDPA